VSKQKERKPKTLKNKKPRGPAGTNRKKKEETESKEEEETTKTFPKTT
jgi:hypothetical protein